MINKLRVVALVTFLVITGLFLYQENKTEPSEKVNEQETVDDEDTKTIQVEEAGLKMSIPKDFEFSKELSINYTTQEPYAVSFTIQSVNNPSQSANPYQLYGIYQWDTQEITEEGFYSGNKELDETTIEKTSVGGKPALKGFIKGSRQKYTYYILLKGHILMLSADGTSQRHVEITDEIIKTVNFD